MLDHLCPPPQKLKYEIRRTVAQDHSSYIRHAKRTHKCKDIRTHARTYIHISFQVSEKQSPNTSVIRIITVSGENVNELELKIVEESVASVGLIMISQLDSIEFFPIARTLKRERFSKSRGRK